LHQFKAVHGDLQGLEASFDETWERRYGPAAEEGLGTEDNPFIKDVVLETHHSWRERGCTAEQILRFCRQKDVSCYGTLANGQTVVRYTSKNRNHKAGTFIVHNGHCYILDSTLAARSLSHKGLDVSQGMRKRNATGAEAKEQEYDLEERTAEQILVYEGTSNLVVSDRHVLDEVHKRLLARGIAPKLSMLDTQRLKTLELPNGTKVHYSPFCPMKLTRLWKVLGKPFKPCGIGAAASVLLETVLRKPRAALSEGAKGVILARQEHKCARCGGELEEGGVEYDHVRPLHKGGSNDIENMQA
jgi:hypothetical protein